MEFAPVKLLTKRVKEAVSVQEAPLETRTEMILLVPSTMVLDTALESKELPDTPVVCGELFTKNSYVYPATTGPAVKVGYSPEQTISNATPEDIAAVGTVSMVIVTVSDKALHPALSVTSTFTLSKFIKSEKVIVLVAVVTPAETEIPFLKNSYKSPPDAVKRTVSLTQAVFTETRLAVGAGSTVMVISLLKLVHSSPLNVEIIFLRKTLVVEIIAVGV